MSLADIRFPGRPVAIDPNSVSRPRGYVFLTLVMLVLAGFMALWQGPDLMQDMEISKHPLAIDGDIQNGRCTTRKGFLTDCEAHLVYSYGGRDYQKDVHLFFADLHFGDYQSGMVIDADHPEMATLSIGIEKLWDRIVSLAAIVGIILAMALGMMFVGLRVARVRRQLARPATLEPLPVEITAFNRNRRGLFVTYADKIGKTKTNRTAYTHFPAGEEPLILGTAKNGHAVALAARHGRTSLPVLLDAGLGRVDLTDEERRAVLGPVEAELAPYGGMIRLEKKKRPLRILRGILTFVIGIALIIAAVFGFWLWYVTQSTTQYNQVGMEINNMLPQGMNRWGCSQLQKRFGDQNAPFGCAASDFRSWK